MIKSNSNKITHARIESSHLLAHGLFRSLKKGERKTSKLDITYDFSRDKSVRFVSFEPLGVDDLKILRAIVALASRAHHAENKLLTLDHDTTSALGTSLRHDLYLKDDAVTKSTVIARTSFREIAKVANYASSSSTQLARIKASILRMSNVSMFVKNGTRSESYHLLSFSSNDDLLHVALNMKLAEVMLSSSRYAYIDFDEANALKSDAAVLLHSRLCATIDFNKSQRFSIDTLCSYVYHDETTPQARSNHRKSIRRALEEIKKIDWKVIENNDIFTITRSSKKS